MTEKNKKIICLAMARGIFMGLADMGNMDALFPEVKGDWHSAANDPEKVQRLAEILQNNQNGERHNVARQHQTKAKNDPTT